MTQPIQAHDRRETRLWYWFLFDSPFSTLHAKRCLARWQEKGLSLTDVLDQVPDRHRDFGIAREEARQLRPPKVRPAVQALRWNSPHYPDGLHDLPLKRRPALLFVRGETELLTRPIVTFVCGNPDEDGMAMLREAMGALLGEHLLLAALADSTPAKLLLEEMAYSDGEILLFPTSGMDCYEATQIETRYVDTGRLALATPLPPTMAASPGLKPLLQQIASAASARRILSTASEGYDAGEPPRPTLVLTPTPPSSTSPHLQFTDNAADVLLWVQEPDRDLSGARMPSNKQDDTEATPLTPEQTLSLLEQGGVVPPALRARLTESQDS